MNKAPAFQFFPRDWKDKRVQRMDYFARGVYIELLGHMWNDSKDQCSIEKDERALIGLLSLSKEDFHKAWSQIQWTGDPIFYEKGGRYISKRLQHTKREQLRYRRAQVKAGKKGAEKRWGRHSDPTGIYIGSPPSRQGSAIDSPLAKNSSSPTPSTTSPTVVKTKGGGKSSKGMSVFVMSERLEELVKSNGSDGEAQPMAAYEILTELGMKRGMRGATWKLSLNHPLSRFKEVARMCVGKRNPAGFAVDALEKGWK